MSIFNGKDFTGWFGNNPHATSKAKNVEESLAKQAEEFKAHWTVENGEMVNDGNGPYATTEKEYGDVELELEYKTVAKGDSGIYMRGTPQIQIWDYTEEGGKWKLGADKGSGGLWNNSKGNPGKDPLVLADKPFGEWNKVKARMLGSRTWVWLNDQLVVDGAIWENFWDKERLTPLPPKGHIHLQTHGAEIRWKNIKVREIGSNEAAKLLRADDIESGFSYIFDGKSLDGWSGETQNYEVVDGTIRCKEGKGGTLFYNRILGDYTVRFDFKLPPGGNNGLAIRYPGKGDTAYVGMCELQILDNTAEKFAKLDERQYHGSAYGIAPAARGYLRPVGQWNTQEVTVTGHRVKVELNGSVILDADLSTIEEYLADKPHPGKMRTEGFFGFAGHGDPVEFRNVAVKQH
ncbi:MAG: DUF1080 domain-containing protein [Verrucomicrobiales bacterium]|nr:DUF1080 domain-containing protein [Verrucomicrobiales bacterium]